MDETLRQLASIFDYYSDQLTTVEKNDPLFNFWLEIDKNVKRLYSIGQVLDTSSRELVYPDFESNFQNLCNTSLAHVIDLANNPNFISLKADFNTDAIRNTNITDSTRVEFFKLYTHLIVNLRNLGYIDSDGNFNHIFFVIENFEKIKGLLYNKPSLSLNLYCNYLYGRLSKPDSKKVQLVAEFISKRIQKIKGCFYADLDVFLFKNSKTLPDLDDVFGILGLPYSKKGVENAIIISQKKYFMKLTNGEVLIRGFPELTPEQLQLLE